MTTANYNAAVDSNQLTMSYVPEVTWGVTPDNPTFQSIRLDSEGFTGTKTRTRPNEIDPSGQSSAAGTTKQESTGSLNFSVSAGLASNVLLAASMDGVWTTPVSYAGTDVAVTVANPSAGTLTITATAGAFTTTNLLIPGQFIKLYAAGSSANSGIARVVTVAASQLTLDCFSGSTPAVALAAAMGACTIKGSCLRNGTTVNTFTFEKQFTSALFLRYAGAFATGGSLDVGVGSFLTGTLAFLNKAQTTDTAGLSGATYTAAPNRTVINSISGIGTVWRGVNTGTTPNTPAAITGVVSKLGIKWNKESAAAQFGIGSSSAQGIRSGKNLTTGTMSTYFHDFALYNQFINEQSGPISFYAIDGDPTASQTQGYMITICNATIMNPKVVAGGPNQDVSADFEIEGNPDISSTQIFGGKTIQIDYFGV